MTADHIAALLNPREWALRVLDRVRDGENLSRMAVDTALHITGDIYSKEWENHEHDEAND